MPTASGCSSRPAISSSISRAATTSRTTPSVLPRSIASFEAFENAMTLDISMGGSTNTVLHLLAAAHEAEIDFTMADIDRLSRRVPGPLQGRALGRRRPHRGRAPRRRHHGHPGRTRPRRPHQPRRADGPRRVARARAVASRHQAHVEQRDAANSSPPRPAACRPRSPSARAPLRVARPRPRQRRDPRRRSTPSPRTAASRCSMAISPSTARS